MIYSDKNIVDSWLDNAKPWITAIRKNEIKSRIAVTNKAITEIILQKFPKTVLDIGCGEGWLARELSKANVNVLGIDAVPELVEAANEKGGGTFKVISYENLNRSAIAGKFDIIVCNFSLLGKEIVSDMFKCVPLMLNSGGYFIVQTVHPVEGCGDVEYDNGWRQGSWAGFNNAFKNPAPWYFRTIETWKSLFLKNGFVLNEILEPIDSSSNKAASIIFIGGLLPPDLAP